MSLKNVSLAPVAGVTMVVLSITKRHTVLVFTTRVSLEVLEKICEKLHAFCSSFGLTYTDNRNIR